MAARRWLWLLPLAFALADLSAATRADLPWRIWVAAPTDAAAEELVRLTRQAQEALQECLRIPRPLGGELLRVQLGGPPPAAADPGLLYLPAETPSEAVLFRLHQAALARHLRAIRPALSLELPSNTDWLAAALARRQAARLTGNFALLASLLPHRPGDRLPELDVLCSRPVDPQWVAAFELYSRHCDLLLTVLQTQDTGKQGRLRRVLELQAVGRPAVTALELAYADKLGGALSLQEWYARKGASLIQQRHGRLLTAVECAARLDALLARQDAALAVAEKPVAHHGTYPWERLLEQAPPAATAGAEGTEGAAGGLPEISLSPIQRDFLALLQASPLILRPELERVGLALRYADLGDAQRFRRELAPALAAFRAAADRCQAMTRYLDGLETTVARDPVTLALLRQLARDQEPRRRRLDPPLAAWLDELEQRERAPRPPSAPSSP